MTDILTLPDTIPVCAICHRVLQREDWAGKRPKARCAHCGVCQYYAQDGRVVLTARTTRER